ncbi:MAG: hypothetical protein KGL35_06985, partial [Bradyrhizobium sp.]|nr:hypothetical protein [Bradyrhizobium sp.]
EARRLKERLVIARANLFQLMEMEERMDKAAAEYAEGQSIDAATSQRVSEMIGACLHHKGPSGATVAELSEMLGDVKRSTISATLYNMKQRGQVEHNETAGKYFLAHEVRRHLTAKPK